jgi:hypothetical protein
VPRLKIGRTTRGSKGSSGRLRAQEDYASANALLDEAERLLGAAAGTRRGAGAARGGGVPRQGGAVDARARRPARPRGTSMPTWPR